tara:strand:- start:2399 stop:2692 length:294 start_codon:yes stop_codon:yes gene_type:complete
MDINHAGIQEPKGFDGEFNNGFPITELENNEIEVPYYESDGGCDDESEMSQAEHYETESDYTSSDESVVPKRVVVNFNRPIPNYKTLLCVETDFLPE